MDMLTLTGFWSWLRALACSDWGLSRLAGSESVRQFALYERNFGWVDVWEMNPEE
jgi:hypothetical protein